MIEIEVDAGPLQALVQDYMDRGGNFRRPLNQWRAYMIGQTIQTFNALRTGGAFRGVTWPYFAPQYRRKTDGVEVPAWGGVPYARQKLTKRGTAAKRQPIVKGKKRPSGKRIKQGDAILQDTRTLLRSVTTQLSLTETSDVLIRWGTKLKYAEKQQARRPFLFITDRDRAVLEDMVVHHLLNGERNGKSKP